MDKIHLLLFGVIILMFLYFQNKTNNLEKMTATVTPEIRTAVKEVYKADVQAIKNLGDFASTFLSSDKKELTLPFDKLNVGGILDVKGTNNIIFRGTIVAYNSTIAPLGWVLCDGQNGTPDLRGRFILGGGQGAGLANRVLAQTGGQENVTLTVAQMPAHTHNMNQAGEHSHYWVARNDDYNGAGGGNNSLEDDGGPNRHIHTNATGNHTHTINNTGGGQPHDNMPPYYVLTYIMKL